MTSSSAAVGHVIVTQLPQLDWWVGPLIGFGVAVFSARHLLARSSSRGLQVTSKARTREQLYQIAGRAFGFPTYEAPPEADSEQRRQLRDLRAEHKRQTVTLAWHRRSGLTGFTVAHPVDIDTRPGIPARTEFEAMVRANLPCAPDHRWVFAWPDGVQQVEGHLEAVIADDVHRAFDLLAPLLGYEPPLDAGSALDVERSDSGAISSIDAVLPTAFPVTQLDRRLAVQRDVNTWLRSPQGTWQHAWHPLEDRYRITAAPQLPVRAPLPVAQLHDWSDRDRIPFGVTHRDEVVSWDTTANAHMLLAGATGAGKTTTGRAIVLAAILLGWDVRVCDPKRDEDWAWLANWSGATVATTLEQMHQVIGDTHQLMEHRSAQRWEAATRRESSPSLRPVLLYVDELADLFMLSRNTASKLAHDADELRGDCQFLFGRIAAKGRAPRVHLVGATQRPSAEVLDGDAKFNLQMRVGLGNLDPVAGRIIFTNAHISDDVDLDDGTGGVIAGRGIVAPGAELIDAQMFWTSLEDAYQALPGAVEVLRVEREPAQLPPRTGSPADDGSGRPW